MQSWTCEFFTFVWWCLFNIPSVAASKTNLSCDGLYMAESSIPNAGWGVFAGRIFQTGDVVVRRLAIVSNVFVALVHVVNFMSPDHFTTSCLWFQGTFQCCHTHD
jgi:hypothetical protein